MKLINKHKFKYELYRLLQSFAFGKLKNEIYNKKIKYKCLIKNQINGKGNKYSIEQLEKFGIKLTINGDNNEITIGNDKVWCGKDVKILKHVKISSDTMIGTGSIITGQFDESNVVIAGNPGKIIKRGIKWITTPPQIYAEMNPDKI